MVMIYTFTLFITFVVCSAVCLGFVLLTLWCLRRFLAKKREEKEKKKKKKPKGPVDLQVRGVRSS
jgi:hypothetical protein